MMNYNTSHFHKINTYHVIWFQENWESNALFFLYRLRPKQEDHLKKEKQSWSQSSHLVAENLSKLFVSSEVLYLRLRKINMNYVNIHCNYLNLHIFRISLYRVICWVLIMNYHKVRQYICLFIPLLLSSNISETLWLLEFINWSFFFIALNWNNICLATISS